MKFKRLLATLSVAVCACAFAAPSYAAFDWIDGGPISGPQIGYWDQPADPSWPKLGFPVVQNTSNRGGWSNSTVMTRTNVQSTALMFDFWWALQNGPTQFDVQQHSAEFGDPFRWWSDHYFYFRQQGAYNPCFYFRNRAGQAFGPHGVSYNEDWVRIDSVKPHTSYTISNEWQWARSKTITVNASDVAPAGVNAASGIRDIALESGSATHIGGSGPGGTKTFDATEEGYKLFRVYDNAGNNVPVEMTIRYIDRVNPSLSITTNNNYWTRELGVTLSASDSQSGINQNSYVLQSAPPNGANTSRGTNYRMTANGRYTFAVSDNVGNQITNYIDVSNIDRTAPSISVKSDDMTTYSRVTITGSDSQSGVTGYSLSKGSWDSGWKTGNTFDVTENGTYTAWIKDAVGNYTTTTITIGGIDPTPPRMRVEWSKDKTQTTVAKIIADDPESGISGLWFKGPGIGNNWVSSSDGIRVLQYNGTYSALARNGKNRDTVVNFTVNTLDRTPPTIDSIDLPGKWKSMLDADKRQPITVQAHDTLNSDNTDGMSGRLTYRLDSGSWQSSNRFYIQGRGEHTIYVSDGAGWVKSTKFTINNYDDEAHNRWYIRLSLERWRGEPFEPEEYTNKDVYIEPRLPPLVSGFKTAWYRNATTGGPTVTMTPITQRDSTVRSPGTNPGSFQTTCLMECGALVSRTGTYEIGARSLTDVDAVPVWVTINIDKILPDISFTLSDTATSSEGQIHYTVTDRKDNNSCASGIVELGLQEVGGVKRRVKCSNETFMSGSFGVTKNGKYYIYAQDRAGNYVRTPDFTIALIDKLPPLVYITDPSSGWTNRDITLTARAKDRVDSDNIASGIKRLNANGTWYETPTTGTYEASKEFVVSGNGSYPAAAMDKAGNTGYTSLTVNRIDKVAPLAEWNEDITTTPGKAIIYLRAWDELSGIGSIKLPNGIIKSNNDAKTGFTDSPICETYEITQNGTFVFEITDRAGNKISKTFTFDNLRHDYYVDGIRIVNSPDLNSGKPIYETDFDVDVTWGNRYGSGKNIPVELLATSDSGTRRTVMQETINIQAGTTVTKRYRINIGDIAERTALLACIDPVHRLLDDTPSDNIDAINFTVDKIDYAVRGAGTPGPFSPGQRIKIPVMLSGTGLGKPNHISVELKLDGQTLSKTYQEIGRTNSFLEYDVEGTIPKTIAQGNHSFSIVINEKFMSKELTPSNNTYNFNTAIRNQNLGLKVNGRVLDKVDTVYQFSATDTNCNVRLEPFASTENIISIVEDGKLYTGEWKIRNYTLKLAEEESKVFYVTVQSACKQYTHEYQVTFVRPGSSVARDVWCEVNGNRYDGEQDAQGNYLVGVPVGTTVANLNIRMKDPNAQVVSIDSRYLGTSSAVQSYGMSVNSTKLINVIVSPQDISIRTPFTVQITNTNQVPTVSITNKSEVSGKTYTTKGILNGNTFTEYGPKITSVDAARSAGRTSGLILEIAVKDTNKDQFLRGSAVILGTLYPIHWNVFDGPLVMQASSINKGYIYVDSTAIKIDNPMTQYTVQVQDFKTDVESDTPISGASAAFSIATDITGPVISASSDNDSKMVFGTAADSNTGVLDMQYRSSENHGTTWTGFRTFNGSASISGSGSVRVELLARDKGRNESTTVLSMNIVGPAASVPGGVYSDTSRLHDLWYVNTGKKNASTITRSVLDAFR